MKASVILALFGFVLAVGFSVAVTENDLADIADEFEVEKLPGGYDMKGNDGEFDEEDLEDEDWAFPAKKSDVAIEDEHFDERVFEKDDDGDEANDGNDVSAVEKSADPARLRGRPLHRRRNNPRTRRSGRRYRKPSK